MTQMLLPPGGLIVILQLYLLREVIMVPQVTLPQDRPINTPLLQTSLEGLLTLLVHSITGGPVTSPLIWNCLKPKVAKLQKEPLARQYPRVGWDPHTHHSPRTASTSMTLTFLLRGNGKQRPILEPRSCSILKVSAKKHLIQIFLLHGKKISQGTRILIQICHHHGIDHDARTLTPTSLHHGEDRGPNLLTLTSLHLEGVPTLGRRLHTCIPEQKLGWSLMFSGSIRNSRNRTETPQTSELSLNSLKLYFETSLVGRGI